VCGEEAGRRCVRAEDTTGPRWPRRRRRRPDVRAVSGDAHGHREDDGGGVRSRGSPENYCVKHLRGCGGGHHGEGMEQ
jgi:hypothetical protein